MSAKNGLAAVEAAAMSLVFLLTTFVFMDNMHEAATKVPSLPLALVFLFAAAGLFGGFVRYAVVLAKLLVLRLVRTTW